MSWLVRDMTELEKRGIPTVAFTAQGFFHDARRSGQNFGMPNVSISVAPLPFTNTSPGAVEKRGVEWEGEIIKGLPQPLDTAEVIKEIVTFPDRILRFE